MSKQFKFVFFFSLLLSSFSFAQVGPQARLSGFIIDKNTQKPLAGVSIEILPTGKGVTTDSSGFFRIITSPGTYNLGITRITYQAKTINNIVLTSGNETTLTIELEPDAKKLDEVVIVNRRNSAKATSLESPLSVQRMTTEEIKRNPGGNFDISKVIQSLPGVGGGVGGGGFRNDIIIRGGAPSENVYYLDGIEIPVINHFGTQGSGGGPQGILNANFIEEVKMNTSAFDARYDNALSSVLQFKQKSGNSYKTQGNVILSATELAITLDGPLSKKTTYLASIRRSYLQLLFEAIDLPIRPNYWDYQFKTTTRINDKTTLSFMGIGAIDEFKFAAPKEASDEKLYVINSNPMINQWNYTIGASLKKLTTNGFWNLALSRNTLNNQADKYEDNDNPSEATRTLLTNSTETENKLRFDATTTVNGLKLSYGASAQYVDFDNNYFNVFRKAVKNSAGTIIQPAVIVNSVNNVDFLKYGAFVQLSKRIMNERMAISLGTRIDGNSLGNSEANPFKQFSPRLSVSYAATSKTNLNASIGQYHKLPAYTQLAFSNPLASAFSTNEPIIQDGKGKAYGIEFLAQKKLTKRFFGILSYTFYHSTFTDRQGKYIPASWDNRHLVSLTWGYKFKRNWELGLKFRYQGAAPYTPFDMTASRLNFLTLGTGILDNRNYNSLRLDAFHASDVRIDKKWNFNSFTLDLYLDVTNWYVAKTPGAAQYTFKRNGTAGFATTDGNPIRMDGSNAIPLLLDNSDAFSTPSFGFIVEF